MILVELSQTYRCTVSKIKQLKKNLKMRNEVVMQDTQSSNSLKTKKIKNTDEDKTINFWSYFPKNAEKRLKDSKNTCVYF